MGTINALAEKTGSQVIPADATNKDDLDQLIDQEAGDIRREIRFCFAFHKDVCQRS